MTYTLTDVLVSGYSISADGDNDPAAGVNPEQAWNDDTANIGLIDDTNITPPAGAPIFIQVHTT